MSVKPIIIHDKENEIDYTLEFSRESVKFAEQRGFSIEEVEKYPLSKCEELFFYAFRMHHKNIAREKTDKLLLELGGVMGCPDGFMERLSELYLVPFSTLKGEEERKNSKLIVEL